MRALILLLVIISCTTDLHAQYNIKITPVDSNIYLYTSYGDVGNYKNIDANAVIVVSGNEAVLFDTPWDNMQAEQLLRFVQDSLKKDIKLCIITHAHADRIGSIETMHKNNIPTLCYKLTAEQAPIHKHPAPEHTFINDDTTIRCGNIDIVAYYPGAGHTIDNTVLYIPAKKFLYGGCFIKSGLSRSIGNIADADVTAWPESVKKMQQRFQHTGLDMVIPGHGSWESDKAIANTLQLLTKEVESNY